MCIPFHCNLKSSETLSWTSEPRMTWSPFTKVISTLTELAMVHFLGSSLLVLMALWLNHLPGFLLTLFYCLVFAFSLCMFHFKLHLLIEEFAELLIRSRYSGLLYDHTALFNSLDRICSIPYIIMGGRTAMEAKILSVTPVCSVFN